MKNKLKRLKIMACVVAVSGLGLVGPAWAQKTAILISVATSGVEEAVMEESKQLFTGRTAQLGKVREFKHTQIFIDDLSSGNPLYSGTVLDLMKGRRAERLLEDIKRKPSRCQNLVAGFRKIGTRLRQLKIQGYTEFIVLIWGSLIDTGSAADCQKLKVVNLPQLPSLKIDLAALFHQPEIKVLTFLNVNDWQLTPWGEALEPTMEYAAEHGTTFHMYGTADTHAVLGRKMKTWLTAHQ